MCVSRSLVVVPYLAEVSIYWRPAEPGLEDLDAELRILIFTRGERNNEDDCLETREGFSLLASSSDVVVCDKTEVEVRLKGNLAKVAESGRIVFNPFRENRATIGVRRVEVRAPAAANLAVLADEAELCTTSVLLNLGTRRRPP